jgi:ribosome-binding protein aMBF1 (putative translation factor)
VPEVARETQSSSPIRNVFGLEIRRLREAKGWSQSDLARKLQLAGWDVERTVITKIELRRRCITDYELSFIADVLKVGLEKLVKPKRNNVLALLR